MRAHNHYNSGSHLLLFSSRSTDRLLSCQLLKAPSLGMTVTRPGRKELGMRELREVRDTCRHRNDQIRECKGYGR